MFSAFFELQYNFLVLRTIKEKEKGEYSTFLLLTSLLGKGIGQKLVIWTLCI